MSVTMRSTPDQTLVLILDVAIQDSETNSPTLQYGPSDWFLALSFGYG